MSEGREPTRGIRYTADDTHLDEEDSLQIKNCSDDTEPQRSPSVYSLGNEINEYLDRLEGESQLYRVYPGAESETFDFTAERNLLYSTNLVESAAHIVKGCLGAGILIIHEGFMYGGLWTALIGTFLFGILMSHSMLMLVRSAQIMYNRLRVSMLTYPDLAEVSVASGPCKYLRKFGKPFRYLVDLSLFLEMFGTCCIYEIIIASTIKQTLQGMYPKITESISDIRWYILIASTPLLLLCMIKNLKFLAPFSMVADLFVVICIITALYYSLRAADSVIDRPAWKNLDSFIRFNGICLYSLDAVGICLPVENHMRAPKYFMSVLQIAMTITVLLTAATGFFGYWGWGEDCRSPITTQMPHNIFTTIMQFLLATMLCVTFAVNFWVPFRLVWHYIGRRYTQKRGLWERLYRIIYVVLITCVSMVFPNLTSVIVFMGNFFLGIITFVYPPIIENFVLLNIRDIGRIKFWWTIIKNNAMICFGIALCCSAFYSVT